MSRKIPDILTLDEQKQLLDQFNLRYITSHRNRMVIKLLLHTGLRLSEMINLKWKSVNLMTGQIKVVEGKGLKDRILYINEITIEELQVWKERAFDIWGKSDYLFTSRKLTQLHPRAVREMIVTYTAKAGIDKNITPHNLRHSFASDLLRNSKNIRIVQKSLGHANISTTQIYTHIIDDELESAMIALSNNKCK